MVWRLSIHPVSILEAHSDSIEFICAIQKTYVCMYVCILTMAHEGYHTASVQFGPILRRTDILV